MIFLKIKHKCKTTSKVLLNWAHTEQSKSTPLPYSTTAEAVAKCHRPPACQGNRLLLWSPSQAAYLYSPGYQETHHTPPATPQPVGLPFRLAISP